MSNSDAAYQHLKELDLDAWWGGFINGLEEAFATQPIPTTKDMFDGGLAHVAYTVSRFLPNGELCFEFTDENVVVKYRQLEGEEWQSQSLKWPTGRLGIYFADIYKLNQSRIVSTSVVREAVSNKSNTTLPQEQLT